MLSPRKLQFFFNFYAPVAQFSLFHSFDIAFMFIHVFSISDISNSDISITFDELKFMIFEFR